MVISYDCLVSKSGALKKVIAPESSISKEMHQLPAMKMRANLHLRLTLKRKQIGLIFINLSGSS